MEELLIEKVRQYEFLYNQHLRDYRDKNMRDEAWNEIGKELNTSGSQVKDKWAKLRNCYCNALKRRTSKKSGQGTHKHIPWKYEKEMSFIQPYLDTRRTHDNLTHEDNLSAEVDETQLIPSPTTFVEEEEQERNKGISNYDNNSTNEIELEGSVGLSNVNSKTMKRKRASNPAEEMVKIMKQNAERRLQKQQTTLDENDMFFLSMSKNVKKLPELQQAVIRMEVCKLVSEAQIKHLSNKTPTTSHEETSVSSLEVINRGNENAPSLAESENYFSSASMWRL